MKARISAILLMFALGPWLPVLRDAGILDAWRAWHSRS